MKNSNIKIINKTTQDIDVEVPFPDSIAMFQVTYCQAFFFFLLFVYARLLHVNLLILHYNEVSMYGTAEKKRKHLNRRNVPNKRSKQQINHVFNLVVFSLLMQKYYRQ